MTNIRRILIANRGEIAARVIRTCRRLGVETVLTVSEPDRDGMPARLADRVICIGPAHATASYLRVDTILAAAIGAGVDAVHPGYGFLSESADLARGCEENGLCFIGPTSAQIAAVGDKIRARKNALEAGVPVLPGAGPIGSIDEALTTATSIGFPVLLKAVGGGGGRGMKRVDRAADVEPMFHLATAEAGAAFGDARVYLERCVTRGRHVEVQLIGDGERVLHLGDRDCSIQRRYQKLVEEAPAPGIPSEIRNELHAAAVRFGRHLNFRSLGTVEFLYDVDRLEFYFLEMNARIQVEHPVTEMISGLDLVAEQIAIAEGRALSFAQSDVKLRGHAIECRINAEDPDNNFRPSPGKIAEVVFPEGAGIRVDTHIASGARISPFYDSLIAKIVCHGSDRDQALQLMRKAISACRIDGVSTNCQLHARLMESPDFRLGGVETGFLPRFLQTDVTHVQD